LVKVLILQNYLAKKANYSYRFNFAMQKNAQKNKKLKEKKTYTDHNIITY